MKSIEQIQKELHMAAAVRNLTPTDDPEYCYWQHQVERLHHIYMEMKIEQDEQKRLQRERENEERMNRV